MILSIGTDRPKQTVQTQIRLVLKGTPTLQYLPNSRQAMLSSLVFLELRPIEYFGILTL